MIDTAIRPEWELSERKLEFALDTLHFLAYTGEPIPDWVKELPGDIVDRRQIVRAAIQRIEQMH